MALTKKATCDFKRKTLRQLKKKVVLKPSFNLYDLHYEAPDDKDLAVGLVYFNASKSKRLLMNYLYVAEKFKVSNIPFFTLEMHDELEPPEIKDAFHVKTDFILFQKERLCHLLEKMIPKSFTKLLFLDSDLLFENRNWYNELSLKLDTFNIVQPFSMGVWLDITYKQVVKQRMPIIFYNKFGKLSMEGGIGGYHPGFAWGFQRQWFKDYGFFQEGVLGDGDTLSSTVWLDYPGFEYKEFVQPAIEDFRARIKEKPSICFLEGSVYHLWHGDQKKRQYTKRRKIFKGIKDIRDILYTAPNGLYALKNDKLKAKIRAYFMKRDDDGLPIV